MAESAFSLRDSATGPRLIACIRCQRSKIKCDRKIPCSTCAKRNVPCAPGTAIPARQRRKRFPERELLDRVRKYEGLLRDHSIEFEPLHKEAAGLSKTAYRDKHSPSDSDDDDELDGRTPMALPPFGAASNYWDLMVDNKMQSPDYNSDVEVGERLEDKVKDMWANAHQNFGFLLPFGQPRVDIDLSDRHPDQATIFKLWQIYLDNVNPLLKVTHTPTLQARLVEAGTNIAKTRPALQALMFSIYCVAILSLREIDCQQMFNTSRQVLLTDYQLSCQQALSNCGVLKTTDRECLTAFYLYIVSVEPSMDPYSISALLGIAVRIATRMGLPNEFSYAKLTPLEAELRRRLWWSLTIFDTRVGEMASQTAMLVPTWDCALPSNLNDYELHPDMTESPQPQTNVSEAIFAVARAEMSDCLRHASFYLDFVNPSYKFIAQKHPRWGNAQDNILDKLDKLLHEQYLDKCNPENYLHAITIWMTKELMGKNRLLQHYSQFARDRSAVTDEQRDSALEAALAMLECDAKMADNHAMRGFHWYLFLYFPFSAYFHTLQDLRQRPGRHNCMRAWEGMSANYDARVMFRGRVYDMMFKLFAKLTLSAWKACETAWTAAGVSYSPCSMVVHVKAKLDSLISGEDELQLQADALSLSERWSPMPHIFDDPDGGPDPLSVGSGQFPDLDASGQSFMSMIMEGIDWTMPDFAPQATAFGP